MCFIVEIQCSCTNYYLFGSIILIAVEFKEHDRDQQHVTTDTIWLLPEFIKLVIVTVANPASIAKADHILDSHPDRASCCSASAVQEQSAADVASSFRSEIKWPKESVRQSPRA